MAKKYPRVTQEEKWKEGLLNVIADAACDGNDCYCNMEEFYDAIKLYCEKNGIMF